MKLRMDNDREARFLAMVEDYDDRFMRIAWVYAKGHDAEDLLQDIWLQVWRSLESFQDEARLDTWAYRVALNTAISYRRKPRPEHREIDDSIQIATASSPHDTSGILEDFLMSLRAADRAVLLLHLEGRHSSDIAGILGMSPAAAATRLTRIRKQYESRYLEDHE